MAEQINKIATPLLALVVVIGVVVLLALGFAIPAEYWAAVTLVLGYFFGKN